MDEKERYENSHNQQEYTDKEVRRIAYKYMTFRRGHYIAVCLVLPCLLFFALLNILFGVTNKFSMYYGSAGMFGAGAVFVLRYDIFYIYKTYKKEEKRLRDKYGDEFLERTTWFKKRRKD